MRTTRVLFYADMEAILPHCLAAAEILRSELGAHIIMTIVDRKTYLDTAFENYELYDHESLFQLSGRFVPVEPVHADGASEPIGAGSASAVINRNASPGDEAPRAIQLFGLRKKLARVDALKAAYGVLRRLPSLARRWFQRTPMGQLIAQSLLAWRRGLCVRRFLRAILARRNHFSGGQC